MTKKIVDSSTLDENLTDIADAIRSKTNTSESLSFPSDFVDAISSIETDSSIEIDSTLTQAGSAADAKAVGDALATKATETYVNTKVASVTPVRGTDYWTDEDRRLIIAEVVDSIKVEAPAAHVIYGDIDANNNITIYGELPAGTYTLKYEDAEGNLTEIGTLVADGNPEYPPVINYTNLAKPSDSNWIEGKRINSSKQIVDWVDTATGRKGAITNYFDVSSCEEYIHVKGLDMTQGNSRYYKYNTIGGDLVESTNASASGYVETASYDSSVQLIPAHRIMNAKIWRLGGLLTSTSEDVIITIDEEIQ